MKVTGTWKGEYTYGRDYGQQAGQRVPFTMSLSESWLGKVTGYVRDDAERGGMPERGKIAGKRRRDVLQFVKSMPNHYAFDGSLEPLGEWAQRNMGAKLDGDLPPHCIYYSGSIALAGVRVEGTWTIPRQLVDTDKGAIEIVRSSGTWTARKVSDEVSAV